MGAPARVFVSYSHRDEMHRTRLATFLASLRREGLLVDWCDRRIVPGERWETAIDEHVDTADVILLLVSANFIASDYCYGREMSRAIERERKGDTVVIPIMVSPADWSTAPFQHLQALPTDRKPVTRWTNRDEAWLDVVKGIRTAVERLLDRRSATTPTHLAGGAGSSGPTSSATEGDEASAAGSDDSPPGHGTGQDTRPEAFGSKRWTNFAVLNAVIGALLILVFRYARVPVVSNMAPCIHPWARGIWAATLLLASLHLIVRLVGRPLLATIVDAVVRARGTAAPEGVVRDMSDLADAFQPRWLLAGVVYAVSATCMLVALAGLSPWSPCRSRETAPVIGEFVVRTTDRSVTVVAPGAVITVTEGSEIIVEARCMEGATDAVKCGATVPDNDPDRVTCEWTTPSAKLGAVRGCATRYVTGEPGWHPLSVAVRSACKTESAFSGIVIHVVPDALR